MPRGLRADCGRWFVKSANRLPESDRKIGVLISGRGSNLQALIDAVGDGRLLASIAVVIANDPAAPGLERARRAGIEALVVSHRARASREDFDRELVKE